MDKLARRQVIDVFISLLVILFCSLMGLVIGTVMSANWQERQWAMLYCVAFIGSLSSFFCLIKLSQIIKILVDLRDKDRQFS